MNKAISAAGTAVILGTLLFAGTACGTATDEDGDVLGRRLENQYGWTAETPAPKNDGRLKNDPSPENASASVDMKKMTTVSESAVAKSETPVAKSETPVAKSETPVAKSETPVAKSETPVAKSEKICTVDYGESLWSIAVREYRNGNRWDLIYEANKELLKGKPDNIRPGMKLRIPVCK